MPVQWHRVCFDPRSNRKRFATSEDFDLWLAKHFSQFNYRNAGYTILAWHECINTMGIPLWNILIPGQSHYGNSDTDVLRFLSERSWAVDDYDAIVYLKYAGGGNELLFPIRECSNA